MTQQATVTAPLYVLLDEAFGFFNQRLWDNGLPSAALTLQRKKGAYGYFHAEQFASDTGASADEIAMNPQSMRDRTPAEFLSTFVHEMAHLWQQHNGKPSRTGYHNKEWAREMMRIGLIPSTTGTQGGKQTGQKVSHYIDPDGLYIRLVKEFLNGRNLDSWYAIEGLTMPKNVKKKTCYICDGCEAKVWGKPAMNLICGDCDLTMYSDGSPDDDDE